jgi:Protein of unknown function (DUF2818)
MTLSAGVWLVVILMAVGANLPFLNQRVMVIGPRRNPKSLGMRAFELLSFYGLIGVVAIAIEHGLGQVYPQRWEFYATTFALFVTLAFPGFVYRYLLRR